MPPLNAKVADTAPDEPTLTPYDEQHADSRRGPRLPRVGSEPRVTVGDEAAIGLEVRVHDLALGERLVLELDRRVEGVRCAPAHDLIAAGRLVAEGGPDLLPRRPGHGEASFVQSVGRTSTTTRAAW